MLKRKEKERFLCCCFWNILLIVFFNMLIIPKVSALGIEVECVQTDNGMKFTKQFLAKDKNSYSMFEKTAKRLKVKLKRIKPGTPKYNGKVERSHREDQKLFCSEMIRLNHLITDENDFKRCMLILQNPYLKIGVLLAFGGRVWYNCSDINNKGKL